MLGAVAVAWAAGCAFYTESASSPGEGGDAGAGPEAGCGGNEPCARGVCRLGLCEACTTSADCTESSRPRCEPTNGRCEPCTSTAQCPDGLACVQGECLPCTNETQCVVGRVCIDGRCGPCTSYGQCSSGVCDRGQCIERPGHPQPKRTFVGLVGPTPSKWTALAADGGELIGFAAGTAMCKAAYGANARVCVDSELYTVWANGFGDPGIAPGETIWLHRTTGMQADGKAVILDVHPDAGLGGRYVDAGAPAKGGRCDDWRYDGNDAYDGEWAQLGREPPVFHVDDDTTDNGNDFPSYSAPSPGAAPGVLPCGGVVRKIACCK